MSDGNKTTAGLRERLTTGTEDKIGKALAELIENPLITGTIGRAFDARERAAQAQELALSALNIPTAADIERLTRRLRSVSQRLEGIEDGVHRINRALSEGSVERRLEAMEEQLKGLGSKLSGEPPKKGTPRRGGPERVGAGTSKRVGPSTSVGAGTSKRVGAGEPKPAGANTPKGTPRAAKPKKTA